MTKTEIAEMVEAMEGTLKVDATLPRGLIVWAVEPHWSEICMTTDGIEDVRVIAYKRVPPSPCFRAIPHPVEVRDRAGAVILDGDVKGWAEALSLEALPRLNVMVEGVAGVMFASEGDAQLCDAISGGVMAPAFTSGFIPDETARPV